MDTLNMPMVSGDAFETDRFNTDSYVKKVAAESVYASNIADHRDKLNRMAQQTAEEIKQNVYKNYGNFMETSKEVGHLEGKMSQLRQSLDEQRKLLHLFKNLNIGNTVNMMLNASNTQKATTSSSSLSLLLEQVEGCSLIAQKPNRNLLYHSDLEALHLDDFSVSHKLHAYLLTDSLLLTLPQRKRNKTNFNPTTKSSSGAGNDVNASLKTGRNYLYKFHAFYELQEIKIINIEDSKEVRNSFQLHKFPECIAFRCANAHIKKEWLENIDNAKRQLKQAQMLDGSRRFDLTSSIIEEEDEYYNSDEEDDMDGEYDEKGNRVMHTSLLSGKNRKGDLTAHLDSASEHDRVKIMRELFAEFDILLAQRDFDKAVEMLIKIKQSCSSKPSGGRASENEKDQSGSEDNAAVQQLIYKQKESELIGILRRDLVQSKERGNSKGVVKTGKRVVNSMIKLKIYDEAMDLFIDYHKYLNSETLRRIKLEESNQVYMNNVLNSFFDNLKQSYASFNEQFGSLASVCFSTYLGWCDTEIEILIKKLQSQHYLGRHFDLTVENCELIFDKARKFSEFDVRFWFETKLSPILEQKIAEQQGILVTASIQRSKLELEDKSSVANNEQNRQSHIKKLINELEAKDMLAPSNHTSIEKFNDKDIELIKKCTVTGLQFSRGVIDFFLSCMRVYYQDINYAIIESIVKLFKAEIKIYTIYLDKLDKRGGGNAANSTAASISKQDIYNNVCLVDRVMDAIVSIYGTKAGIHSNHFDKLKERMNTFKKNNFASF